MLVFLTPNRKFLVRILGWTHIHFLAVFFTLFYCCCFLCSTVSVLRGHSFFSFPPQSPMTSDFNGNFLPRFYPLLILSNLNSCERASISLLPGNLEFLKMKRNYWYHFYNLFGMTQSLAVD